MSGVESARTAETLRPAVEQASYVMPGACPVCASDLHVVRLECATCGTAVVGRYRASPFSRLSQEQLGFLEAFLRARGNIKRVERELGISYPTVRNRLYALLAALGISPASDEDDDAIQRRRRDVLDQLEAGRLTPDEAATKLRELGR
jgi:hypothetical protein